MVITESELRARRTRGEVHVTCDDVLTPAACDYLREHGVTVVKGGTPVKKPFPDGFIDAQGRRYAQKPEHMTHLAGNLIVPKTHPRITLRGKLDSLQAKLLEAQIVAQRSDLDSLVDDLEEILCYVRDLLGSEVKEEPFMQETLLGMDEQTLRKTSHNVRHVPPNYRMGEASIWLNSARALAREAELTAVQAFVGGDGAIQREDILLALNRLSSAIYILCCREAAKFEGETRL